MTEVAETGSTNADLLVSGASGAPHGTVLRADHQTAGRGRLDRRWEAPAGANLLVSILLRGVEPAHDATRAVALAAVAACRDVGVDAWLKWPNDLVVGDDKIAGILAQVGTGPADETFVVVGLGLNVAWAPPGAASLVSAGASPSVTPSDVCASLLGHLASLLAVGHVRLHDEYAARLATVGRRVRVETPSGTHVGVAESVDDEGRILVACDDGQARRFDTADVVHLRADPR